MKNPTPRRSSGAAHNAAWIPGLRRPLMAPEDAGGGAAASAAAPAPASTPAAPAPASSPGTAPGGSENMLPQSRVNELVGQARREGREAALREIGPQPKPAAPAPVAPAADPAKPGALTEDAVISLMDRERAFTHASTGTYQLTAPQLQRMTQAFRAEKPTDVAAWTRAYADDLGFKPIAAAPAAAGTQTTPTSSTEAGRPPVAAAPSAPARVDPVTAGGLVDIWNLPLEEINRLGPWGLRAEQEKILAAANQKAGAPPVPRVLQPRKP